MEASQRRLRDGLEEENPDSVPSEEQIERMEERLEEAQSEQKNLFLIIFQVGYQPTHNTLSTLPTHT